MPRIIKLRKERLRLRNKIRSLAEIIKTAKRSYLKLYRQYNEVCKRFIRIRKAFRDKIKNKKKEKYYDIILKIEINKQIDQFLNK
jgi:hypothetical protein